MSVVKLVCYGIIVLCLSCQTVPKPLEDVSLPIPVEQIFSSCSSGQGALSVNAFKDNEFAGAVEIEWKDTQSKPFGWQSQFLTPIGQELLRFSYIKESSSIHTSGRLSPQFSNIAVSNGFLKVDGHFVGIRPEEISCFLGFKLPRKWLEHLVNIQEDRDKTLLVFHDKKREIRSVYSKIDKGNICSSVTWSNYWGMVSSTLTLCLSGHGSNRVGTLQGIEGYRIKWKDIDE